MILTAPSFTSVQLSMIFFPKVSINDRGHRFPLSAGDPGTLSWMSSITESKGWIQVRGRGRNGTRIRGDSKRWVPEVLESNASGIEYWRCVGGDEIRAGLRI